MSEEVDSRKDSQSTKLKQRFQISGKLNFKELCDTKLSGSHLFDNLAIIY